MACLFFFTLICILSFSLVISKETKVIPLEAEHQNDYETYIVHVSFPDGVNTSKLEDMQKFYQSLLPKTTDGLNDVSRMVYNYRSVIAGFAARLSAEEVKEMDKMEGFVYARPQKILNLHTTRSPKFMGLDRNHGFWPRLPRPHFGEGVIIGVVDNGIKPNHPSFSDGSMPEVPEKWKGKCDLNGTKCNKKLIGAMNFDRPGYPVEVMNHGTHTSSTAAGNFVEGANVHGQADGTASGIAPLAHLAMYQGCGWPACRDHALLAAMEAAVDDGVDVLSISLGGDLPTPFYDDSIAIGAFYAIQKGVFVSCSAGNDGPIEGSLSNTAPWILTVGASTLDRNIRATAVLGNNETFDGESLYQPNDFPPALLSLVYPGKNGDPYSKVCAQGFLNKTDVKGKVVLCEYGGEGTDGGQTVKDAGGAAMIAMNSEFEGYLTKPDLHVLPATLVSFAAGQAIKAYIDSTSTPTATILFKGTVVGVKTAPMVVDFSSRGPSRVSPGILKPDIIGPGFSVMAAWASPEEENNRNTTSTFHLAEGTSMSCPHLSGTAALIKSVNPKWSPAAIKSAIITTANILNQNNNLIPDDYNMLPANVFATGAGHVNPSRAAYPGLVYDIQPDDYIPYLCGLGYKDKQISIIVRRAVKCSSVSSISEAQLNYPSFAIELGSIAQTYTRTVTNVGNHNSTYDIEITVIPGVDVIVQPSMLEFTKEQKQMTYQISFVRSDTTINDIYVQGAITWISKKHRVRSPISVRLV